MKILLLNENPVITKLVTLSTQKLGFDLEQVEDPQNVGEGVYDLVIIDDQLYDDTLLEQLGEKIEYKKTLCIHKKGEDAPETFDYALSKPFLPTELVDILADIQAAVENASRQEEKPLDLEASAEETVEPLLEDDGIEMDAFDSDLDEFDLGEDIDLEDELGSELKGDLDEALQMDLDEEILEQHDDTVEIDDALDIDGGILDEEDLKEVQDLLEEEKGQSGIEEENLTLEDLDEKEIEEQEETAKGEMEGSDFVEEEFDFDLDETEGDDLSLQEDTDENFQEEEEPLLDDGNEPEEERQDLDIDGGIVDEEESVEDALDDVEELEDEVTQKETSEIYDEIAQEENDVDDEIARLEATLEEEQLNEPIEDIDEELASLDEFALKEALGETASDVEVQREDKSQEERETEAVLLDETADQAAEKEESNAAVTTLKKLLQALEDKEIAASLKDQKIQITITIGGE